MFIRSGYLLGSRNFEFDHPAPDAADLISAFIRQYYEKTGFVPKEILVPVSLEDRRLLEEMLSQIQTQKVHILRPQRGEKARLIQMAGENAALALKELAEVKSGEEALLKRLARRLRMADPPRVIECIDNSNISGTLPVAGLVSFENGRPNPSGYLKYTIRTVARPDDYATMAEVLGRRFGKEAGDRPFPDLFMLDGGKGQLNIAVAVLKSLGLWGRVHLLAIAKRDEHRGETEDKIYLPGRSNPLVFGKDRDLLLFLQRIRDEAHRFALSFHRSRRSRAALTSELDAIAGIGKKRKQTLLKHFGGIDAIREATMEEIGALPGMGIQAARAIRDALGKKEEGHAPAEDAPSL
jgi:excinuclease ABC subunit C